MTEKQQLLKDLYTKTEKNAALLCETFHLSLHPVPDTEILDRLAKVSANLAEIKGEIDHQIKTAKSNK